MRKAAAWMNYAGSKLKEMRGMRGNASACSLARMEVREGGDGVREPRPTHRTDPPTGAWLRFTERAQNGGWLTGPHSLESRSSWGDRPARAVQDDTDQRLGLP